MKEVIILGICLCFIYCMTAIGLYKVFQKCGIDGWKAFVPLYNTYHLYQEFWKKRYFWSYVLAMGIYLVASQYCVPWKMNSIYLVTFGLFVLMEVLKFLLSVHISKGFGHKLGYAVGIYFFPFVFYLILGFGKSFSREQKEPDICKADDQQ